MVVNNFDAVARFIPETFDGDTFYYTELLDRTKRSGNNKGRIVRTYYHRTRADLYDQEDQIIRLCDFTRARAYTRLTPRSFIAVGRIFARQVLEQALIGSWEGMRHAYSHAAGTTPSKPRRWIFDVDHTLLDEEVNEIIARPEFLAVIPSRKGRHIITTGFDLSLLRFRSGSSITCHKDNPTNLYIPENA